MRSERSSICGRGLLVGLLLLSLGGAGSRFFVFGQSGRKPVMQEEKPVFRLETLEVVVPLIAYGANGKFVNDLALKDIVVLEEKEPRPVASLKREPANIVLILDGSNEVGTFKNGPTRRFQLDERPVWERRDTDSQLADPTSREFALRFLERLSPRDQVAIIQYSDRVQLLQNWTGDMKQAADSLRSKYRVGIRSSYYDALKLAGEKLEERKEGRRIVVLLSDGIDSASRAGRSKAMLALDRARATVFVIGWAAAVRREIELAVGWMRGHENFTTASARRLGDLRGYLGALEGAAVELRQLAETSGGIIWMPATHADLTASFRPLAEEIGAQYSLTFISERKPSLEDRRSIEVISARAGMHLLSCRSYYVGSGEESAIGNARKDSAK